MLAEKLNMTNDEAEKWIVDLIRNARLDAKIDSKQVRTRTEERLSRLFPGLTLIHASFQGLRRFRSSSHQPLPADNRKDQGIDRSSDRHLHFNRQKNEKY